MINFGRNPDHRSKQVFSSVVAGLCAILAPCVSQLRWLLRPREWRRSIALSTSVCVSVCLSVREHISGTTRAIFTNFSVHVAYGRGSVLFRQGNEILRGRSNFWGCPGHSKALAIFAAAVALKRVIQSPITSCSRRDHSVCQESTNRNTENSERRRRGL